MRGAGAASPPTGAAVVARAADTPLRPALPGAPGRLAGSGLARLVEPGAVPIAVDLVFAGNASAPASSSGRPAVLPALPPPPPPSTSSLAYEFTYVLDGRGALRPAHGGRGVRVRAGDSAVCAPGRVWPSPRTGRRGGGSSPWTLAALSLIVPAAATAECAAAVSAAAAARAAWFEPAASPAAAPVGRAAADAAVAAARSHAAARSRATAAAAAAAAAHPPPPARRRRAGPAPPPSPAVRRLADLPAFRLAASNRLALAFDPFRDGVPFTVGVEVFDPGHETARHTHPTGHELFFVLAGTGTGWCDGQPFRLEPGDVAIFPPTSVHGLDADPDGPPLACLELLAPNDAFAEKVRAGEMTGRLADEELCALAAVGCG